MDSGVGISHLLLLPSASNVLVRQQVCIALGKIGPGNEEAVPALLTAVGDPEWTIRRQALLALGEIEAPLARVEEALQQCEADPSPLVRKAAQETRNRLRHQIPQPEPGP